MTTIKSYTDLEQSKRLAEFLPLESSDGFWEYHDKRYSEGDEWEGYEDYPRAEPYLEYTRMENEWKEDKSDIPCWSLAALIDIIENIDELQKVVVSFTHCDDKYWVDVHFDEFGSFCQDHELYDSKIDALIAIIEKMKNRNLL